MQLRCVRGGMTGVWGMSWQASLLVHGCVKRFVGEHFLSDLMKHVGDSRAPVGAHCLVP